MICILTLLFEILTWHCNKKGLKGRKFKNVSNFWLKSAKIFGEKLG